MKLAIITGESSGDALGASLARTLRARGVDVSLTGVGGPLLAREGLASLFPQSDIAVMGFAAVIQRLPLLLRRISETARAVAEAQPDLLLTIDSPDFCLRVAKKVRAAAPIIPIMHWVCPSVWAWRPGRARKMAPHVDEVLCLLPFEPDELRKLGGPRGVYVGHPLIERLADFRPGTNDEARARNDAASPEILLLPGSRRSEVVRVMTRFGDIARRIKERFPGATFTLPAVAHVRPLIEEAAREWTVPVAIVVGEDAKLAAFRRARAALAASGTVTLELALAGVPMVAVYRVAEWEAVIARRMIRVSSVLLPNLILGRNATPEFLQENFTVENVTRALSDIIADGPERSAQLTAFDDIERLMRSAGATPSERAADEALAILKG